MVLPYSELLHPVELPHWGFVIPSPFHTVSHTLIQSSPSKCNQIVSFSLLSLNNGFQLLLSIYDFSIEYLHLLC